MNAIPAESCALALNVPSTSILVGQAPETFHSLAVLHLRSSPTLVIYPHEAHMQTSSVLWLYPVWLNKRAEVKEIRANLFEIYSQKRGIYTESKRRSWELQCSSNHQNPIRDAKTQLIHTDEAKTHEKTDHAQVEDIPPFLSRRRTPRRLFWTVSGNKQEKYRLVAFDAVKTNHLNPEQRCNKDTLTFFLFSFCCTKANRWFRLPLLLVVRQMCRGHGAVWHLNTHSCLKHTEGRLIAVVVVTQWSIVNIHSDFFTTADQNYRVTLILSGGACGCFVLLLQFKCVWKTGIWKVVKQKT